MKKIAYLGLLLLASCAQKQVIWEKYGVTKNELNQDYFACERASQVTIPGRPYQPPPTQVVSGRVMPQNFLETFNAMNASLPTVRLDEGAFANCMQYKGYRGRYK